MSLSMDMALFISIRTIWTAVGYEDGKNSKCHKNFMNDINGKFSEIEQYTDTGHA